MLKHVIYVCNENDPAAVLQFCFKDIAKVTHAESKESSLSELNAHRKIDLLLVDYDTPKMILSEYLAVLEKKYPDLPVIIAIPNLAMADNFSKERIQINAKKITDVIDGRILNTEGLEKIFRALCLK